MNIRKVRTIRGESYVTSLPMDGLLWAIWQSNKRPAFFSVRKEPLTSSWMGSVWGKTEEEVKVNYQALMALQEVIPSSEARTHRRAKPVKKRRSTVKVDLSTEISQCSCVCHRGLETGKCCATCRIEECPVARKLFQTDPNNKG